MRKKWHGIKERDKRNMLNKMKIRRQRRAGMIFQEMMNNAGRG